MNIFVKIMGVVALLVTAAFAVALVATCFNTVTN